MSPPPPPPDPKDHRRSPRIRINREFSDVDEFLAEYVTNISTDGAFIRTDTPLPIGTAVNLRFSIIMEEVETICGVGEVVRVVEEPREDRGMGVVFVELQDVSKKVIETLFTRQHRMAKTESD